MDPRSGRGETWHERARRRRETRGAYLLGALFGLCVVGASLMAAGDEEGSGSTLYPASGSGPAAVSAR